MDRAGSRILTIPNVISLVRLLLIPVFLWLLLKDDPARRGAALLLGTLGASDWVDGYIARHFNQTSELGKILDPTADRVLLLAGAIALFREHLGTGVNIVLGIVVAREIVIAVASVVLGILGARRIDVVWAGKAGTLALMFALPMFLVAKIQPSLELLWNFIGWGFAIGGIVLGYYAAVKYVPAARDALRDGRAARVAEVPT